MTSCVDRDFRSNYKEFMQVYMDITKDYVNAENIGQKVKLIDADDLNSTYGIMTNLLHVMESNISSQKEHKYYNNAVLYFSSFEEFIQIINSIEEFSNLSADEIDAINSAIYTFKLLR